MKRDSRKVRESTKEKNTRKSRAQDRKEMLRILKLQKREKKRR